MFDDAGNAHLSLRLASLGGIPFFRGRNVDPDIAVRIHHGKFLVYIVQNRRLLAAVLRHWQIGEPHQIHAAALSTVNPMVVMGKHTLIHQLIHGHFRFPRVTLQRVLQANRTVRFDTGYRHIMTVPDDGNRRAVNRQRLGDGILQKLL